MGEGVGIGDVASAEVIKGKAKKGPEDEAPLMMCEYWENGQVTKAVKTNRIVLAIGENHVLKIHV